MRVQFFVQVVVETILVKHAEYTPCKYTNPIHIVPPVRRRVVVQ
jgi:hypothetical protein